MLMLVGHAYGWPVAKGGSQRITDALVGYLESLGAKLETGRTVTNIEALPTADAYIFDTSPSALANIAGDRLPIGYAKRLRRELKRALGVQRVEDGRWKDKPKAEWSQCELELFTETETSRPIDFHSCRRAFATAAAWTPVAVSNASVPTTG